MNKDILYSFRVAEKLKEADVQQQQQQQQAPSQQQQQPTSGGNVDQSQIEKAFEAALQTIKTEIISGVQEMMEKFGEQLVSKINGGGDNNKNASPSDNSNNNASNESNNNNNKEENTDGNQ